MSGELDDLYRSSGVCRSTTSLARMPSSRLLSHLIGGLRQWRKRADLVDICRSPPTEACQRHGRRSGRSARQHGITDAEERGRSVLRIATGALPIELHRYINNLAIAEPRLLPRLRRAETPLECVAIRKAAQNQVVSGSLLACMIMPAVTEVWRPQVVH
jgi:hypothetical protein